MQQFDLGRAEIHPGGPIVAGSFTTITFTYTAGHPIDDSGYLMIAFRSVSDFGEPQFWDPAAPNYCRVETSGDCKIEPRWDTKGNTRPWDLALYLMVRKGFLDRGETIRLVFGDRSGGSPGWQMQTFCMDRFEFKTFVDPIATYQFKELPESPGLRIIAGEPARAVCIAPSQVLVNQGFSYYLKLEDRWGNPTALPQILEHPGWGAAGIKTIEAVDPATGLAARSNPIDVLAEAPPLHPYWADFHAQSEETIGSNSIESYFTFARDYARLDIVGHQGNDFQVTDEFWDKINAVTRRFYKPGSFVTFPGYEWSGNTPLGGDRNVFFASEGGQISRSSTDLLPGQCSKFDDSPNAAVLFEKLARQTEPRPFAFAHVGGRYADIRTHDPEIELAMEVHSAWGTFEWLVDEALRLGYRIGICANSDGHKGRPGASYPGASTFGSLGGLTCVLARALDRESIYEALKMRHFYATSGNRPLLSVRLLTAGGDEAMMGDIIDAGSGPACLQARAVGTGPVESLEVRCGSEVVRTFRPYGEAELGRRVKIVWSGAEVRGRDRLVRWDGGLQVQGNTILDVTPVNFWNANQPLQKRGANGLSWKSVTTGGLSGVILTLENAESGLIKLETLQGSLECEIASLGLEPSVWDFDGLKKEIRAYRLPDRQEMGELSVSLTLPELRHGDNPIYVRITQEDGHMAWSSPVYLVKC